MALFLARIPAEDLETLVVQRLMLRWLSDKLALLDALSAAADDAAVLQGLLAAASARCHVWPKLAPEQVVFSLLKRGASPMGCGGGSSTLRKVHLLSAMTIVSTPTVIRTITARTNWRTCVGATLGQAWQRALADASRRQQKGPRYRTLWMPEGPGSLANLSLDGR